MQLKKITTDVDYYVVVTDEPIKEGDWVYNINTHSVVNYTGHGSMEWWKKITHSTQPLDQVNQPQGETSLGMFMMGKSKVQHLDLSYIKSLVGEELSVKEKVSEILNDLDYRYDLKGDAYWLMNEIATRVYAIEDNKDKRFSEEDLRKAIEMARQIKDDSAHDTFTAEDISGCTEVCTYGWREKYSDDDIISSLTQPKDTWEVEFDENNNLKLK